MGGAVIELGLAEPWEDEPPPPPRWPPRVPHWLPPAAVAVATLLTMGAAAAPRRWDPVLSQRDPNTQLHFASDDTAMLTTLRIRGGRLQAYRPGRTAPLWTATFPNGHPVPLLDRDPGLLTLSVFDSDPNGQGTGNAVQGRDARTGRLLWARTDRDLLSVGPAVAVLTDRTSPVPVAPGIVTPTPTRAIEAVDRRTGQTLWTRAVEPGTLVRSRETAGDLVELTPDGRLRLSDPSTGAALREHRLALLGTPLNVQVDGGLVVVFQESADLNRLSLAYDLATGAERWRNGSPFARFCGDHYLCTSAPEHVTVTDLVAGVVRYQGRGERFTVRGDRLTVSWPATWPRPARTEIRDLRTGRRLHAYPGWTFAGSDDRGTLLSQETAGAGLMVATLDHASGRLTVIGRATRWTGAATCTRGIRFVGCVGLTGVRVWRLPR